MPESPLVSIIVPHYSGRQILINCLKSIWEADYASKEVLVVDNNSTDGSVAAALDRYPQTEVVRSRKNLGYAGGCNYGLQMAHGKYVLFLNDDAIIAPDLLVKCVSLCETDHSIAACQPKVLSLVERAMFDYAGAAGGLMDRFGYPFALGRVFFTMETDHGQYDQAGEIFWASGAGMVVRKSAIDEVGSFDEDYFAHMEEIDLCWRFHLAGYRVLALPQAVVYHSSATTLKSGSARKIFLNHRNSLLMLLKNYELRNLLRILPIRLFLELLTLVYAFFRLDFVRWGAVLRALLAAVIRARSSISKRKEVKRIRRVSDNVVLAKMYSGSIAFDYFIRGIRRAHELPALKSLVSCKEVGVS